MFTQNKAIAVKFFIVSITLLPVHSHALVGFDEELEEESKKELTVDVGQNDIGMCRILGKECDKVFNPVITYKAEYQKEDLEIIKVLSTVTSEEVDSAFLEQNKKLSDKVVEVTAKTLGTQTGYAVGVKRIHRVLGSMMGELNNIVSKTFRRLMIMDTEGRLIQPPIIESTENNVAVVKNGKSFRAASQSFYIRKPARFVIESPTWESYFDFDVRRPSLPASGLLPKTAEQEKVWKDGIRTGYAQGIKQAEQVFEYRLSAIAKDIDGLVRYHVLRAYNMVSEPKISQVSNLVTGGGRSMNINDQILNIEITPQLNAVSDKWKSLPRLPDITNFNIDNSGYRFTPTTTLEPK